VAIVGSALVVVGGELAILSAGIELFGFGDGVWLYSCGVLPMTMNTLNAATESESIVEEQIIEEGVNKLKTAESQAEMDEIAQEMEEEIEGAAEAADIIAEVGEERALSLSTRFLNQSDPLWKNAANIKPIDGYQDIIVHGDKYSFVYKDANEIECNVSVKEFAEILKNSPVYNGGSIRLVSCETGASDAITAQYLANYLGEEVMAPTNIVWVYQDGEMIIGPDQYTNTGTWEIFKPKE